MADPTLPHDAAHDTLRLIRVRSTSIVNLVAGAIAGVLREAGAVEVHAIGAGAINQAIKAIITARTFLQETDHAELICTPYFQEVVIDDQTHTGIRFVVELKPYPTGIA